MLRAPRGEAPGAGAGLPGGLPVAPEGSPKGPGGSLWGRSRSRERAPVPGGSSAALGAWPRLPPLQRLLKWRRGRRDPRAPPPPSRPRRDGGCRAPARSVGKGREGAARVPSPWGQTASPEGPPPRLWFWGEKEGSEHGGGGGAEGTPWAWCLGVKSEVL